MKTLTLSYKKENKTISSKTIFSFDDQEKILLVEIFPFLVVTLAIFRLLGLRNYLIYFTEYSYYLPLIGLFIASVIFALFLFNGFFKKKKFTWIILCIFQGILLIYDFSIGSILTGILTGLVGSWMLIQIRGKYV